MSAFPSAIKKTLKVVSSAPNHPKFSKERWIQIERRLLDFVSEQSSTGQATLDDYDNEGIAFDEDAGVGTIVCATERSSNWWQNVAMEATAGEAAIVAPNWKTIQLWLSSKYEWMEDMRIIRDVFVANLGYRSPMIINAIHRQTVEGGFRITFQLDERSSEAFLGAMTEDKKLRWPGGRVGVAVLDCPREKNGGGQDLRQERDDPLLAGSGNIEATKNKDWQQERDDPLLAGSVNPDATKNKDLGKEKDGPLLSDTDKIKTEVTKEPLQERDDPLLPRGADDDNLIKKEELKTEIKEEEDSKADVKTSIQDAINSLLLGTDATCDAGRSEDNDASRSARDSKTDTGSTSSRKRAYGGEAAAEEACATPRIKVARPQTLFLNAEEAAKSAEATNIQASFEKENNTKESKQDSCGRNEPGRVDHDYADDKVLHDPSHAATLGPAASSEGSPGHRQALAVKFEPQQDTDSRQWMLASPSRRHGTHPARRGDKRKSYLETYFCLERPWPMSPQARESLEFLTDALNITLARAPGVFNVLAARVRNLLTKSDQVDASWLTRACSRWVNPPPQPEGFAEGIQELRAKFKEGDLKMKDVKKVIE